MTDEERRQKKMRSNNAADKRRLYARCARFINAPLAADPGVLRIPRTSSQVLVTEIHVQVRLSADGFPTPAEMDLRDRLEEFIEVRGLGEVVDAGSGLGTMDLRIEAPHPKKALATIRAYVEELGLASRSTCKVVKPAREPAAVIPYQAGDALAVQLPDGEYGAALVLAREKAVGTGTSLLIGVVRYKAPDPPTLPVFLGRHWLSLTHHSWNGRPHVSWYLAHGFEAIASSLRKVCAVAAMPDDPSTSSSVSPWGFLAGQIVAQYSWEDEQP